MFLEASETRNMKGNCRMSAAKTAEERRKDRLFLSIIQDNINANISTLETQNSDRLDFHAVAIWNLKAALEAAYQAGKDSK